MIYFLTLKGVARNKLDELRRVNITPFEIPIPQNSEYDMINNVMWHVRQTGFMRTCWESKGQVERVIYTYGLAV